MLSTKLSMLPMSKVGPRSKDVANQHRYQQKWRMLQYDEIAAPGFHQIQPLKMSVPVGRSPKIRPRILSTFSRGHFLLSSKVYQLPKFWSYKIHQQPGSWTPSAQGSAVWVLPTVDQLSTLLLEWMDPEGHIPKKAPTNSNSLAHAPPISANLMGFCEILKKPSLIFRGPENLPP